MTARRYFVSTRPVALVIGHGPERDRGAYSADGLANELDWNRRLVAEIASRCAAQKVRAEIVHRTRERRSPVAAINRLNPLFAIEFHLNSADGPASGTEMIHLPGSKAGIALARRLQSAAVECLQLPDRGVRTPWNRQGMGFLRGVRAPAVIAESFFIHNHEDLIKGTLCYRELAWSYTEAIEKHLHTIKEVSS